MTLGSRDTQFTNDTQVSRLNKMIWGSGKYSLSSLFGEAVFYKIVTNTELTNTEPLLIREIQG